MVRRPRWGRRLAALGLLLLAGSPWWAPPMLRRLDFFRVRHVEVRGARYTPAAEILARLDLDTTYSIWSDLDPLAGRAGAHPLVGSARVSRRFPGTLVVTLDERVPVAFTSTARGLQAYDAEGRALPLDASRTPVDLPIIPRRDTTLLRLLAEIRTADPALFARVSELRRVARNELVLQLVSVPVRLAPDVSLERLAQIFSVENDLARRGVRALELDLRFRDQVIARLP
ncbi:MAG TPA: FtsQ-type POTRA domain-containing protein [Gemmatimonadaceae bacterium]|nr:FtsQ-type POTRA domain-containing protein [Gemmatimonadaceae bacterium]